MQILYLYIESYLYYNNHCNICSSRHRKKKEGMRRRRIQTMSPILVLPIIERNWVIKYFLEKICINQLTSNTVKEPPRLIMMNKANNKTPTG